MRLIQSLNKDWYFNKENETPVPVSIPHTWNSVDGADGGNDYYRGVCTYKKTIGKIEIQPDEDVFLEFCGINQTAQAFFNGQFLGEHLGGYSKFRFLVTELLNDENELVVKVGNQYRDDVYPQRADFTFYGGIYRDVNLVIVPKRHFCLTYFGSNGMKATTSVDGRVEIEAFFENVDSGKCNFKIGTIVTDAIIENNRAKATLFIENPHLWNGMNDPFLYTLVATMEEDQVSIKIGFREVRVDPSQGFFLNGKSYPLIGVSRHQDREGFGYALKKAHHKEDLDLIKEMGANTIRLAHYQHDDYIYDLADEMGFVIWAEIPYITEYMPKAKSNAISQLKELIIQNYHHPSIVTWGLSNEITTVGGVTEEIVQDHKELNALAHALDSTRFTTMANLFMLETDSELVSIPDLRSYNLYYGWYVGEKEDNDEWFDNFHRQFPNVIIGLSEFGADANPSYHSDQPQKGDYSESYQALYHEHMLAMRQSRNYIWAMHVWNMFDFAADGRNEGGNPGINQKGLVSFDRKTKKDAFYVYKAYLTHEPFVHICEKRYIKRTSTRIKIKVYSNQKEVSLYQNGKLIATQQGDKVFIFDVKLKKGLFAKNQIVAVSGSVKDEASFRVVKKQCSDYIYPEFKGNVKNWFEQEPFAQKEGYFSIYDKVGEIKSNPEGIKVYESLMQKMVEKYGDVAKKAQIPKTMQAMMDKMSFEKLLKMAGHGITTEMVQELNDALNKIKK